MTSPANVPVTFLLKSNPVVVGNAIVVPGDLVERTDETGFFSVVLGMGDYEMSVTGRNGQAAKVTISVPNDNAVYDFSDLIVSEAVYDPSMPPGSGAPSAGASVAGLVKTDITEEEPVVLTMTTYEAEARGFYVANSVVAMRLIDHATWNKKVDLLGLAAAFDGQGGDYYWVASGHADDGIGYVRPHDYSTHLWRKR